MVFNIRQKQSEVVARLLDFNTEPSIKEQEGQYKVLVLDRFCKDVIAPLLRVSDLRRHGVTLHLPLEADRQSIPDVPAVYLIQPTQANINRVIQDATQALYQSIHLNFSTSIPHKLIEQLATGLVKSNAVSQVAKVFDQYVSFIGLEPTLFSLGLPTSYIELNDPQAKDTQIEASISSIVDGLFSVLVTLGVVPIIRCPRGGAAEHVAQLLDTKLRDGLKARQSLFSESTPVLGATLSRPLLALFDRNFDLSMALQHVWTYKPMVHDILELKLNRVTLPAENAGVTPLAAVGGGPRKKTFDVDDQDFFWEACWAHPFPKVAEEVEVQLQKYKTAVEEINKATAGGSSEEVMDMDELIKNNTKNLLSAVSSLPELQEKKKVIDKHTNLATALLGAIKTRSLDQYYNLEEELLIGKGDLAAVLKLVQDGRGEAMDKVRLAVIWLLGLDTLPADEDLKALYEALTSTGASTPPVEYIAKLRKNGLLGSTSHRHLIGGGTGKGSALGDLAGTLGVASQNNILDWADKTFGQGLTSVTKSVKNLLAGTRQLPITTAMEAIMEGKQGTPQYDNFAVFDPKLPPGRAGLERAKGPFRDAIVFVIGGGNYLEREVLMSWATRQQPAKQIIYGSTEILSPTEFVGQLAELATK